MLNPNIEKQSTAFPTYDVLGVPISITSPDAMLDAFENWARDTTGRFVCIRDVASLMTIRDNPELNGIHESAAAVTPDGTPLAWIGRSLGLPVKRTCGPDLFELVCQNSAKLGLRHYFYGGKPGIADKLKSICQDRFPGIEIVGTECPPFRELTAVEKDAVVDRIVQSQAHIVWIGISSPKQDILMHEIYERVPQTLIGVGAAFDFHTGEVKRAPRWFCDYGLEWLHRLFSEPGRLWRRYLILAPKFVWALVFSTPVRTQQEI